jgi:nucleotide-binding universal stress UspA family protein
VFKKLLVPLDGSDMSAGVLEPVWRLLEPLPRGQLTLMHVLPRISDTALSASERWINAGGGILDRGTKALDAHLQWDVEARLEKGDPAEQILAVAEQLKPDLLAMASHGRGGLERMVRGSVAERVLRHTTTPLLLCTPISEGFQKEGPFRHVLVPIDGSQAGSRAVPLAAAIARLCKAQVTLFHVDDTRPTARLTRDRAAVEPAEFLKRQRATIEEAGVERVTVLTAKGHPATEILEVTKRLDCDLLALSTHGRGGFARWSLGSVAESVARMCRAPLLIKPTRSAEES